MPPDPFLANTNCDGFDRPVYGSHTARQNFSELPGAIALVIVNMSPANAFVTSDAHTANFEDHRPSNLTTH